jgi:hypothetical protein
MRVSVLGLLVCLTAAPAAAQVHMQVVGGATSASDRSPFVGVALGARLSFVEIDVEGGRMFDVLPDSILTHLNDLQRERDLPVQALAEVRVTYAFANLRIISPSGPLRPFLLAGAGIARVEPRLTIVIQGISLGDVFGLTSVEFTEPMAVAGAGLRVDLGSKAHFDLGYRYLRVFADFLPTAGIGRVHVNVHNLYGALGVRF